MAKTTITAREALHKIYADADTACPEVRVCDAITVGKGIHQGDVYVFCVDSDHPRGEQLGTRQVAVGTTVGSRHIAEGAGVTVYKGKELPSWIKIEGNTSWIPTEELLGPVVVAEVPWTLTHPEHAHHCLPAGTYQVTYQADFATKRRVED